MSISIVVPAFNEEKNIPILYKKIRKVGDYEIWFVDDGSTDHTYSEIKAIMKNDPDVHVIKFQRNYGKSAALTSAFQQCKNDIIITMDADLQDDPIEIPRFIRKIEEGYHMVSGWKYKRKDPITKTIPSLFFNWMAARVTSVSIHDFNCGFKAYRKKVTECLDLHGEIYRYIPALVAMNGFRIGEIKVRHHARKYGKSKFGANRLLKGFFDLITVSFFMNYAKRPLHFFGFLGMATFLLGVIGGLYLIVLKILGQQISDRPLMILVALMLIIGGQFISLGLLAELTIRKKERLDYIIEEIA